MKRSWCEAQLPNHKLTNTQLLHLNHDACHEVHVYLEVQDELSRFFRFVMLRVCLMLHITYVVDLFISIRNKQDRQNQDAVFGKVPDAMASLPP